jgi:hypothetical protein
MSRPLRPAEQARKQAVGQLAAVQERVYKTGGILRRIGREYLADPEGPTSREARRRDLSADDWREVAGRARELERRAASLAAFAEAQAAR